MRRTIKRTRCGWKQQARIGRVVDEISCNGMPTYAKVLGTRICREHMHYLKKHYTFPGWRIVIGVRPRRQKGQR